jgi:N-acetylmuramoyl-L-alanine amidase
MFNKIILAASFLSLFSCFYAFSILSQPVENEVHVTNTKVFEDAYQVYVENQKADQLKSQMKSVFWDASHEHVSNAVYATLQWLPTPFHGIVWNLVAFSAYPSYDSDEIVCLAQNIYFEARNQSKDGQVSVGLVTLARMQEERKSICFIVKQKSYIANKKKTVCQFSWTCEKGKMVNSDNLLERMAWDHSILLAGEILNGKYQSMASKLQGALNYHTKSVHPVWSKHMIVVATIGDHIFYKNKGKMKNL